MRWTSSWFLASLGSVAVGAGLAHIAATSGPLLEEAQIWLAFDHMEGWLVMAVFVVIGTVWLVRDWPRRRDAPRLAGHAAGPVVVSLLASLAALTVLVLLALLPIAVPEGSHAPPAVIASLLGQLLVVRVVLVIAVVCASAAGLEAMLRIRRLHRRSLLP